MLIFLHCKQRQIRPRFFYLRSALPRGISYYLTRETHRLHAVVYPAFIYVHLHELWLFALRSSQWGLNILIRAWLHNCHAKWNYRIHCFIAPSNSSSPKSPLGLKRHAVSLALYLDPSSYSCPRRDTCCEMQTRLFAEKQITTRHSRKHWSKNSNFLS